jgi:hypothetical protein
VQHITSPLGTSISSVARISSIGVNQTAVVPVMSIQSRTRAMKHLPGMFEFIAQFEEFSFGANADSALQKLPSSFKLCISLVEHLFQAHAPRARHTPEFAPMASRAIRTPGTPMLHGANRKKPPP